MSLDPSKCSECHNRHRETHITSKVVWQRLGELGQIYILFSGNFMYLCGNQFGGNAMALVVFTSTVVESKFMFFFNSTGSTVMGVTDMAIFEDFGNCQENLFWFL